MKTGFHWAQLLFSIHFEWASLNGFVILGNNFTFGPCASEAWGRLGQGIRQVSVRSDCLGGYTLKSLLTQVCPPPSTTWSRPGTSPSGTGWAWRSTGATTAATTSGDIRWWLESLVQTMTRLRTVTPDGQYSEVILGQLSIQQHVRQQFLVPSETYFRADLEVQV